MRPKVYLQVERVDAAVCAAAARVSVADLHEAMGPMAGRMAMMGREMRPLIPGLRVAGPAVTAFCSPGDNLMMHRALYLAQAGDVLVVQAAEGGAQWGDLAARYAKVKGLAGVVVTTKRGGNEYHGSGFYDFNSDGLNALSYNQKLAGAERGEPNSDTHAHRWGVSLGGPLVQDKTFFFASYEGSNQKEIYGGARTNVPTAAMRAGDFSGANFVITDPLTGQPFPLVISAKGRAAGLTRTDIWQPPAD